MSCDVLQHRFCLCEPTLSGCVEIMRTNVDEVTRTWQCILGIFYLFQLYLSHKLHNSQADHPRRTGWYADLLCVHNFTWHEPVKCHSLQEWRTYLIFSFNLVRFRINLGLKFSQSLAPGTGNHRHGRFTNHCWSKSYGIGAGADRKSWALSYFADSPLRRFFLRLHWFT